MPARPGVSKQANVEDDRHQKDEKPLVGMIIQEGAWSAVTGSMRRLDRSQRLAGYKTCLREHCALTAPMPAYNV